MRTTLDIEDDVLLVAKEVARREGLTIGAIVSRLIRKALEPKPAQKTRNGVPLFEVDKQSTPVTLDTINRIKDEENI